MRDLSTLIEAFDRPDYHIGVTGSSRTGKSVLVGQILERCERFVALDRKRDYVDLPNATVVTSYPEAADYLKRHRDGKCRLVVLTTDLDHHLGVIRLLWTMHEKMELPNCLLVIEEAKHYARSSRQFVQEPEPLALSEDGTSFLELIYTEALLYGLVALTVTQFPTQIPTKARNSSDWKITFRYTGSLTDDLSNCFGQYAGSEGLLQRLERLEPGDDPRKANGPDGAGEDGHFLTYPRDLDPLNEIPPYFRV